MKGVSINDYIDANPKDGIEGMCIFGVPKSGKSNMAHRIISDCLKRNNENLVMSGDMFCEFRNLILSQSHYDYEILIPKGFKIKYFPEEIKKKLPLTEIEYKDINIEKYLINQTRKILVIYDAFFYELLLYKRVGLWNNIAKQLLYRTYSLDKPIILLFHEGGVFFPQISIAEQWMETYKFNQLNVDFRKGLVRLILISQLDKEILSTVREKQYWIIYKKGNYSDSVPKPIRQRTPFFAVDHYCISYGGIYTSNNRVKKLPEQKEIWKMIPVDNTEEYCLKHGLLEDKKKMSSKSIVDILASIYINFQDNGNKKLTYEFLEENSGIVWQTIQSGVKRKEKEGIF